MKKRCIRALCKSRHTLPAYIGLHFITINGNITAVMGSSPPCIPSPLVHGQTQRAEATIKTNKSKSLELQVPINTFSFILILVKQMYPNQEPHMGNGLLV